MRRHQHQARRPFAGQTGDSPDRGFSVVEVLVAMGLFSLLSTLLLGLALSTSQVTKDVQTLTNVNEESRLAMERLTRELRQASAITAVHLPETADTTDTTALTFWIDFNGDGAQDLNAADPEVLTYRWNPVTARLTLTANDATGTAVTRPVLAASVSGFTLGLRSSKWQYDVSISGQPPDGITSWQELDAAGPPVGNNNGALDSQELDSINLVALTMTVLDGERAQTYSTQVDLRNRN
jgi:prepilin-type N-terminal cleavage/methylation domain-containing protein